MAQFFPDYVTDDVDDLVRSAFDQEVEMLEVAKTTTKMGEVVKHLEHIRTVDASVFFFGGFESLEEPSVTGKANSMVRTNYQPDITNKNMIRHSRHLYFIESVQNVNETDTIHEYHCIRVLEEDAEL